MPTENNPSNTLLTLVQWVSPSYPVGAFSYSHGLEQLVETQSVHDAETFQCWLTDILKFGAGRNDAILLALAFAASDEAEIQNIDALARALAPSCERAMETELQGAAFAQTTSDVWPAAVANLTYPVAFGVAAKAINAPLFDALGLYLHGFASNLASAAVRLIPLGQTDGQAVLAAMTPICTEIAALAPNQSLDDLGSSTFMADIASMKHETQYSRLFRS